VDPNLKSRRRELWGKIWLGFFVIFFLNMLVVTTIVLLMRPLWYDINEFLIGMIGVRFNWFAIILTLILLNFAHSVFLVFFYGIKLLKKTFTKVHLVNKITPFIFLPVFDFAINLLISEAGSEVSVVRTQLEYMSPLIWLVLIIGICAAAPVFFRRIIEYLSKIKKEAPKWYAKTGFVFGTVLITVICLTPFISPFFLVPSTVIRGDIPPKPILMAHRGASHLAPENTLVAAEQALAYGAAGVEVDLTISYDGIFVLCHDDTLRRTTDVATVFPGRENDNVFNFTLAELRSLDAGSWFVDDDPFNTIKDGHVDAVTVESYRGELIPTLEELINFTRDNGLLLDIDSKGNPPPGHPYHATYYDILLNQLNDSGMDKDILIGSTDPLAENMTYVTGPDTVEELISKGSELVNTHHGLKNKEFRAYDDAGIQVMVWTVDSVSRFSQLWSLGVDYIKTNNLHLMGPLTKPIWSMNGLYYYIIWAVVIVSIPVI